MSDTHDIIAASIASIREDGPGDGGPEPTTPAESEPADTSDLAPAADPDPDAGDSGGDALDQGSSATSDPLPVAPKPAEEKPKDEAKEGDDIDAEPEFKVDATGRKQVNRIPQPRVKAMVEKAVTKAVEAKSAEFTEKTQRYEAQIQEFEGLGQIMATDPDRFVQMLAKAYPAYTKYAQPTTPAAPAVDPANDPMPQPDGRLADGTPAYSPEGFQKVQEWQARQVEQRVMSKVGEKYKYLDDQRAAEQAREAQRPVVRQQMAEAMEQWDGFKDNFDAILTELQQDSAEAERTGRNPRLSLHDAYRNVMTRTIKTEREAWVKEREKLAADRNKQREEILAELRAKPNATATLPVTAATRVDPATADGPRDTRDIIRESIRGLRGAA